MESGGKEGLECKLRGGRYFVANRLFVVNTISARSQPPIALSHVLRVDAERSDGSSETNQLLDSARICLFFVRTSLRCLPQRMKSTVCVESEWAACAPSQCCSDLDRSYRIPECPDDENRLLSRILSE